MEIYFCHPEIEKFIDLLQKDARQKVRHLLNLLNNHGSLLRMPHSKQINDNLFELRARGRQDVRLLYAFHRSRAYILHIFIKKQRNIPLRELDTALSRRLSIE